MTPPSSFPRALPFLRPALASLLAVLFVSFALGQTPTGRITGIVTNSTGNAFLEGVGDLFDGKTLDGWEGDWKWWRVQDGALTGGSTTEKIPHNCFIATTRSFQNFDLRLKLKLTGDPATGLINSGVQICSVRVPGSTEMSGYQVDAGDRWWGKLYDESRRRKVISVAADLPAVTAAIRPGGWNEFRILAEGPRIRSWINGVAALDYVESEPNIARDGHIGVQIHSGGIALVQVKDVAIQELPHTPGAPTWDHVGRPQPRPAKAGTPKTGAPKAKASSAPPAAPVTTGPGGGKHHGALPAVHLPAGLILNLL